MALDGLEVLDLAQNQIEVSTCSRCACQATTATPAIQADDTAAADASKQLHSADDAAAADASKQLHSAAADASKQLQSAKCNSLS
jgi:hypothetical protein